MDLEVPLWLDENFLRRTLQGGDDQEPQVIIKTFSVALAVPAGANYISVLFRVKVNYIVGDNENEISLIVKAPYTSGTVSDLTKYCGHNRLEATMYNTVLPILNNYLKINFAPTLYNSSVEDVIVMDDMTAKGYEVCSRHNQLDYNHCKYFFTVLAKFHATTVACMRDHPDRIIEVSRESLYIKNAVFNDKIKPWVDDSQKAIVETVRKMRLGKEVEDLFESRAKDAAELMVKLCKPKEKGLNVLNHGDPWVNNILFKHSPSGDVEDMKLIDYQLRRYGSPRYDIMYFIWSSVNEDVREYNLPELLEMYRSVLNTTLEHLGCEERYSKEEFHQDIKEGVDLAVLLVSHILPITSSDNKKIPNIDKKNGVFLDSFGGKDYLFEGKYFKALLPKVCEHLLKAEKLYY